MFGSKQGIVLIEMLFSLVVISFIMLLLINLLSLVTKTIEYEHISTKLLQVSSLIDNDLLDATKINLNGQCLEIMTTPDLVSYCITGQNLVRTVNHQGYERILSNPGLSYTNDGVIRIESEVGANKVTVPIWSSYE